MRSGDTSDDLVSEIEQILADYPEEFLDQYVQQVGNGGGQYLALGDIIADRYGVSMRDAFVMYIATNRRLSGPLETPHELFEMVVSRFGNDIADLSRSLFSDPSRIQEFLDRYGHVVADVSLEDGDVAVRAVQLERLARQLLNSRNYKQAKAKLISLLELEPERGRQLRNEFGFLLRGWVDEDEQRNRWFSGMWSVLSALNDFPFTAAAEAGDFPPSYDVQLSLPGLVKLPASTDEPGLALPVTQKTRTESPSARGRSLEDATLEVLELLFRLPERSTIKFSTTKRRFNLLRARRQRSGSQFGHDIEFDCEVAGSGLRCHVECKNYRSDVTVRDVAEKLAQQEMHWASNPIDHWILISPHATPSNELAKMLQFWSTQRRFPFSVHFWGPDEGVEELFALDADLHQKLFSLRKKIVNSREWTDEDRLRVIGSWRERLFSSPPIPLVWATYLRQPSLMCFANENPVEFEDLYRNHVPLTCCDHAGAPLAGTLESNVRSWLRREDEQVTLVLGDFGDGKTGFTYCLARALATEFLSDPQRGWIPLRVPLRDFRIARNGRDLLQRRLQEIGCDLRTLREIAATHRTVALLDGFDEISVKLDPDTITENIQFLFGAVEELGSSKVMITSRTTFFDERRDQSRLLERLGSPRRFRISPIRRLHTIEHLQVFARTVGAVEQLGALRELHDPIGLASKPLFLEMIKATLSSLPQSSFDEITLYETYTHQSLRRKIADLNDDQWRVLPSELIDNLVAILEEVALRLHGSELDHVFLSDLGATAAGGLAALLWRISGESEASGVRHDGTESKTADAVARVGVRSLLVPVIGPEPSRWPATFFHRSMREFFVGRAIARAVRDGPERASALLSEIPMQPEVAHFATGLLRREGNRDEIATTLVSVAQSAFRGPRHSLRGGNALSLLYRMTGTVPRRDWEDRCLDGAQLAGADLSGKSFRGSTLRGANLDNANLEGTDLSHADLTGIRLAETAQVLAVGLALDGEGFIAAYDDGTIREWRASVGTTSCEPVIEGIGFPVQSIFWGPAGELCAFGDSNIGCYWWEGTNEFSELCRFRTKTRIRRLSVVGSKAAFLVESKGRQDYPLYWGDLKSNTYERIAIIRDQGPVAIDPSGLVVASAGSGLVLVVDMVHSVQKEINDVDDVSAIAVLHRDEGTSRLAIGRRDGMVKIHDLRRGENLSVKHVWSQRLHNGVVSGLVFRNDGVLASGGTDRAVCVIRRREEGAEFDVQRLHRTVRCAGVRVDGLQGPQEQEILRRAAGRSPHGSNY